MNPNRITTRIGIGMNNVTIFDSLIVIEAIKELQKHHEIVPVIIFGFNDGAEELKYLERSSKTKMEANAEALREALNNIKYLSWSTPIDKGLKELELDIALVPAKHDSELFGYYKDFVQAGIPCICSDVEPFNKLSPCLTENTKDAWVEAIHAMIMFPEVREGAVNQQKV